MLYICISFDYELFLAGSSLSEEEQLFTPTEKIRGVLSQKQVRATFFADTCSALRYKDYELDEYPRKFAGQLQDLACDGHDIQLHIHSNWKNCSYDVSKGWNYTYEGYSVQSFGFDRNNPHSAYHIIREGKEYLEDTVCAVRPDYQCIAYRAGGFCVCPEKELIEALLLNGIKVDSSVALKQYNSDREHYYDFRDFPDVSNWHFDSENGIRYPVPRHDAALMEVAIGYGKNNAAKFFGISPKHLRVAFRDNPASVTSTNQKDNSSGVMGAIRRAKHWLSGNGILSLDTRGYRVLQRDVNEIYRRYHCDAEDHYIAVLCHPKMASDHTIRNMDAFVSAISARKDCFRFITMQEIAEREEL